MTDHRMRLIFKLPNGNDQNTKITKLDRFTWNIRFVANKGVCPSVRVPS